ncbi:MAG: hypothetical protein CL843_03075 [Crocinitomicaceae bacterium]|nr:hypothetical protein [Crocinitomicaceae bacterium]
MKALFTLLILTTVTLSSFSQNESIKIPEPPLPKRVDTSAIDTMDTDTTRIDMTNMKIILITPKDKQHKKPRQYAHWSGLNLGMTYLMFPAGPDEFDYSFLQDMDYAKSIHWALNVFEYDFDLVSNNLQIVTGAGFSFHNYSFNHNKYIQSNDDEIFAVEDTVNDYRKNRLRATYFNVPLMIAYNTKRDSDKGFHLAAGIVGGVRMATTVRRKWFEDGDKVKSNERGSYNMNPFSAEVTVRMGLGRFLALYANYNIVPMFDTDKGPEVYQFSAGVRLIPFQ